VWTFAKTLPFGRLRVLGMSMVNRSSSVNSAAAPEDLQKLLVQALNSGDLDGLVALYAFDGFLMARTGPARGVSAIRKALAEYVAMKPTIQLTTRRVVQARDTALLVADWRFHGTAADGGDVSTSGTSIEVAPHFLNDVFRLNLALEPTEGVLQRLALLQSNFCQTHYPQTSPNRT
jgi:ketosteroid isomerase-like protein